jgi:hypothetical protein
MRLAANRLQLLQPRRQVRLVGPRGNPFRDAASPRCLAQVPHVVDRELPFREFLHRRNRAQLGRQPLCQRIGLPGGSGLGMLDPAVQVVRGLHHALLGIKIVQTPQVIQRHAEVVLLRRNGSADSRRRTRGFRRSAASGNEA